MIIILTHHHLILKYIMTIFTFIVNLFHSIWRLDRLDYLTNYPTIDTKCFDSQI